MNSSYIVGCSLCVGTGVWRCLRVCMGSSPLLCIPLCFLSATRITRNSPMIDYSLRYGSGETLHLPCPIRTYFDNGAEEWNDCTPKQKLLDLSYVTSMGYDITQDVREILKNHFLYLRRRHQTFHSFTSVGVIGKGISFVEARYERVSVKDIGRFERVSCHVLCIAV